MADNGRTRSYSITVKIDPRTPPPAALAELGRRLATVRSQRGLTQEALAEQAGVGVATLRRIEDGRDARLGSWLRLLQALDLAASADQLLPEHYRSPMAEARADSRRRHRRDDDGPKDDGGGGTFTWGDERR